MEQGLFFKAVWIIQEDFFLLFSDAEKAGAVRKGRERQPGSAGVYQDTWEALRAGMDVLGMALPWLSILFIPSAGDTGWD